MSFKDRVEASKNHLTTAETKVADYVVKHPEHVVQLTVDQLARAAGSSAATVVRMVKKLDIDSYVGLRIMLTKDLSEESTKKAPKLDIQANESFRSIRDKLAENDITNIQQTKDLLDAKECETAVSRLRKTRNLFVFGIGASSLAAENIYQKWSRIGVHVVKDNDMNVFLTELSAATTHDTLWLISNSGETPELIYLAEYAKRRGIFLITLTRFGRNQLSILADAALKTMNPMEPDIRVGATNSITGQFYVIDVVLYVYFSRTFKQSFSRVEASRKLVKDYQAKFKK
ncbi:MurR/RpiR family transcriptional regulator [Lacticaseibacillus hegangensis]|uniref:MurR/RpiR family transcriptional regulator n=1 Tax=Lacticaseibacillus hegangensis TaxID=2486010 RepID=A0ABW4D093_9LACO|nr:MurR/RpiR family transcriptional regulator [Lacticaseibacillus hegangensis]